METFSQGLEGKSDYRSESDAKTAKKLVVSGEREVIYLSAKMKHLAEKHIDDKIQFLWQEKDKYENKVIEGHWNIQKRSELEKNQIYIWMPIMLCLYLNNNMILIGW